MRYLSLLHRAVFARPLFRRLNSRLFYLGLHGLGVLNYQNASISGERYLLGKLLPKLVRNPRPMFFDVGANEGDYCQMLLKQFPTAFVHAFEPQPANYSRFLAHDFPADRVKCHSVALGASRSSLTLYDYAGDSGSSHASLYRASITEFHQRSAVALEVPVETLDDVATSEGIEYIDFLKIDTEGHELAVLSGASRLLRENRIGYLQFEFNSLHVFSRVFFRDFRTILSNYELYRLLPRGLLRLDADITATEIFGFQNILAIPRPRA
jgi:FkbM family methyltransferase